MWAVLGVARGAPEASTIVPLLAEWAPLLGDDDLHSAVRRNATQQMEATDLQTWCPTADTAGALYCSPAIDTGLMRMSVELPEDPAAFRAQVEAERALEEDVPRYPSGSLNVLPLVASRRFRTRLRPESWRRLMRGAPPDKTDTQDSTEAALPPPRT